MPASENESQRPILTPSSLNRLARDLIEDAFSLVWIEGELSNVSRPASGHLYFTLKDSGAQVRGAMFKPRSTWLPFKPADGMHVLARVRVSLYEARGEFQLIAEHMELAGEGALRREFERLKAQLSSEGLFDAGKKRELPAMPRRIGVITSPSGAAIRDVLNVLNRRFPLVEVDILPVPVQGKEAPAAIVAALRAASLAQRHDVLLLTRGGGSLEDLWAFNDEQVARAIAACSVPVVAAIGHEVDFTIADFAADLRAATPSAAAELLVPDRADLLRVLLRQRQRLSQRMRQYLESVSQRVDHLNARLQVSQPTARLARGDERLSLLHVRLALVARNGSRLRSDRLTALQSRLLSQHPRARITQNSARLRNADTAMRRAIKHVFERRRQHLVELARTLHATSPLATMARGYAILVEPDSGLAVRSTREVAEGQSLRARIVDGEIHMQVLRVLPGKQR
ncbi:MAG: exodeoxyribonuclease VII large subunit [Dokdonella sp.]